MTFGGELFLRSEAKKRGYKGPLFEAMPGDLVISKIRVGQGSFCVIGDEFDHVAVSPEYPVYTPNLAQVDPRYLVLALRTPEFLTQLTGSASDNTTKRRIRPEFFESRRIPLPPLDEQRKIVVAHHAGLDHATALEREAAETEARAMRAFEAALGFEPPQPLPDRPVFAASFKDLDRWSHEAILRKQQPDHGPPSKFPMCRLGEVGNVVYGLQKHPGNRPGKNAKPYLRVANVQRGRLALDEIKHIDVVQTDFDRLCLKDRDLLFVEGNGSRENLGRVAIWRSEIPNCVHQNHLIRARVNQSHVSPEFAAYWFNSASGRAHFFEEGKTTSGLGTINSSVVKSAPIPLPPVDAQIAMAAALDDDHAAAADLRRQAAKAHAKAWADFEAAVYAAEDDTVTAEIRPRHNPGATTPIA